eukprot:GEMP01017389.1.p1 GENE.GEMP01017389.1~~GEMP01017389.1.p1  ORF type:complete len:418 (+),score=102.94 GEMP01017389.1:203-1456(+)
MAPTLRLKYMDKMVPLARSGKLRDVENLFAQFQNYSLAASDEKPDQPMYNLVLHACVKSGDVSACDKWLDAMSHARVRPNEISFRTILGGANDLDAAFHWLERMQRDDIEPCVRTFHAVLGSVRSVADSRKVMQMMSLRRVNPNSVTYNILLKIAVADPEATEDDAKQMFAAIDEPSAGAFGLLLRGLSSAHDQERVLERMVQHGMEILPQKIARVLHTHNLACTPPFSNQELVCSKGALELMKKMETWDVQLSPICYGALLSPLARHWESIPLHRRHREVAYWRAHMDKRKVEPNEHVYYVCMMALQDDLGALEKLIASTPAPLGKSFVILAKAYAQSKDISSVEDLWQRQQDTAIGLVLMQAYADGPTVGRERPEALFRQMAKMGFWTKKKANAEILRAAVGIPKAERLLAELES